MCTADFCNKAVISAGVPDMVSGAVGKVAAKQATDKAAEQAMDFGKKLLG